MPPSPPLVAALDHTFLELCGEWHLRNPLRGNLHGGVCEGGERWGCHGRPKRARSWKRRQQPRKAYTTPGSPLLGCNQVELDCWRDYFRVAPSIGHNRQGDHTAG